MRGEGNILSKLVSNYFAQYKPQTYEEELRNFFGELIGIIENIKTDDVTEVKYDSVKYSIYFEIGLFSKRLELVKNNTPDRVDLIESFTDSISILENVIKSISFMQDERTRLKDFEKENIYLNSIIEKQKKEIDSFDAFGFEEYKKQIDELEGKLKDLQARNEELINLI